MSVNPKWYGVGEDYKVMMKDAPLATALERWNIEIPKMKKWGFNTVRLSFRFPPSGTTHSVIIHDELDAVLQLLSQNGFKAILCLQNWKDMHGFFGSPEWTQNWIDLANRFKGDTRIRAYELFNEPGQETWHSSVDGGGAGVGHGEGVMTALAECVDAIRATGDNHTIVYPDPWFIRPTETAVFHPETIPSALKRPNIVVGFHLWQGDPNIFSVDYHLRQRGQAWVNAGWNIYVGEMGVFYNRPWDEQKQWCIDVINYMMEHGGGFNYWMHGYQSREQAWQFYNEILEASNYLPPTPTPPVEPFFPRIREVLYGFPRIAEIYHRVDNIKPKREEVVIKEGVKW